MKSTERSMWRLWLTVSYFGLMSGLIAEALCNLVGVPDAWRWAVMFALGFQAGRAALAYRRGRP